MAYQYQVEDGQVEPVGAIDLEQIANAATYNVVSGCGATYSTGDLDVTIASGTVAVSGSAVSCAGGTVALVPDANNPRWAVIYCDSAGAVQIQHATAAATPYKPSSLNTDGVILHMVKVDAALTIANSATLKLDKRVPAVSAAKKTSGGGYFLIPAGPSAGTSASSSASANTYGAWTQAIASTAAALYIVGVKSATSGSGSDPTYVNIDIGTGGGGSESSVGEVAMGEARSADGDVPGTIMFPYPIPVAATTRIAVRVADSVASAISYGVTLVCINQSDVVNL